MMLTQSLTASLVRLRASGKIEEGALHGLHGAHVFYSQLNLPCGAMHDVIASIDDGVISEEEIDSAMDEAARNQAAIAAMKTVRIQAAIVAIQVQAELMNVAA